MSGSADILQIGLDHRSVPLPLLERLHEGRRLSPPAARGAGEVRLATCHRLELYLEGAHPAVALARLSGWLGASDSDRRALEATARVRIGVEAARHLLRVASGLESTVLGEDQILGQVRCAYREACSAATAGRLLHRLFHAAFRAGKRTRTETPLGQGGRSLAGAAVGAIVREIGSLTEVSALVLGTGEMAQCAATRLRERGIGRLMVSSRTRSRADGLAGRLAGEVVPWEWRFAALREVDAAISATSGGVQAITARALVEAAAGRARPLAVVDLAMPRTVEPPFPVPAALRLADVAGLSDDLHADAERRRGAVEAAEAIVEAELCEWLAWADARGVEGRAGDRANRAVVG
ncbi:MAG: glutamyl-tRNA reductase [Acidobacteriota bacterium]